jgi:hypothetical protein
MCFICVLFEPQEDLRVNHNGTDLHERNQDYSSSNLRTYQIVMGACIFGFGTNRLSLLSIEQRSPKNFQAIQVIPYIPLPQIPPVFQSEILSSSIVNFLKLGVLNVAVNTAST